MNQSALTILVTGVAIGLAVLGLAIRTMRLEREKEKKAARQETGDAATPPPPAPPPPEASPALPGLPSDPSIPELARLLRAPDGALIVEMAGRRYRARAEIAEAAVGRQLLAAANDLSRFVRGEPTTTAPASAPTPVTLPARPAVAVTAQQAAQTPLVKPSMNPFEQLRYLREREKQPEVKIKSFLEEIDEVLQAKIAGTPLIARGVKVTTGPGGTALFRLDDHSYERPDDLPDAEARAVVQAAVREWEKK
ncbi:MAG: hypothetical protein HY872_07410 [Chloroflexi bacterium]|nr:hypothetical protein [Chloroflexota bacterium]